MIEEVKKLMNLYPKEAKHKIQEARETIFKSKLSWKDKNELRYKIRMAEIELKYK